MSSKWKAKVELWDGVPVDGHTMLYVYPAACPNGTSCIVCPGGSYFWLDRNNESRHVVEWLNSCGITVFLLAYYTAGITAFLTRFRLRGHVKRGLRSMQDVFMALNYVKTNATELGVDAGKVGVLGFSAGGHMALMAAQHDGQKILAEMGVEAKQNLTPAFVGAIYPVVSFVAKCTHQRSRRGLIGDFNAHHADLHRRLSAELNVSTLMPPVFLLNCADDTTVDPENSRLLSSAMTQAGASIEYHSYPEGGHGFGANDDAMNAKLRAWKPAFIDFVNRNTSQAINKKI